MAKFIKLTALDRNNEPLVLNIEMIEYMQPIPGSNGTALISTTHHTKYRVQESMDDVLKLLRFNGMLTEDPREFTSCMNDLLNSGEPAREDLA